MKKLLLKLLEKWGYTINPTSDIKDAEFWKIYKWCKPYTMTTIERMYALYCSVNYVINNKVPGSFVECGVWRGGSSMLIAKMLTNRNIDDRKIYLFDTFEGMTRPTDNDKDFTGKSAASLLKKNEHNKQESLWALADLSDVQNNMRLTNFPEEKIVYIKGKVETTIPTTLLNESIALLRLDTDWYTSTKHELLHLFPKLENSGVLIIDDYGHWEGCKKAVDEYFMENGINILLNRIDYTGRVGIKFNVN